DGLSIRLTAILNTYLLNLPGKLQRLLNTTIQKFLFTAQRPFLLTNALGIGLGGGFNFLWGKWWLLKQNQAASSPITQKEVQDKKTSSGLVDRNSILAKMYKFLGRELRGFIKILHPASLKRRLFIGLVAIITIAAASVSLNPSNIRKTAYRIASYPEVLEKGPSPHVIIKALLFNNNEEERYTGIWSEKFGKKLPNILKMYLGLEKVTLPVSEYKPTSITNKQETYYSIKPWSWMAPLDAMYTLGAMKDFTDPKEPVEIASYKFVWPTWVLRKFLNMKPGEIIFSHYEDNSVDRRDSIYRSDIDLANHLQSFGKDEKGVYLSIYDVWDFNPNTGGFTTARKISGKVAVYLFNFIGKNPLFIYDRYYISEKGIKLELERRNSLGVGDNDCLTLRVKIEKNPFPSEEEINPVYYRVNKIGGEYRIEKIKIGNQISSSSPSSKGSISFSKTVAFQHLTRESGQKFSASSAADKSQKISFSKDRVKKVLRVLLSCIIILFSLPEEAPCPLMPVKNGKPLLLHYPQPPQVRPSSQRKIIKDIIIPFMVRKGIRTVEGVRRFIQLLPFDFSSDTPYEEINTLTEGRVKETLKGKPGDCADKSIAAFLMLKALPEINAYYKGNPLDLKIVRTIPLIFHEEVMGIRFIPGHMLVLVNKKMFETTWVSSIGSRGTLEDLQRSERKGYIRLIIAESLKEFASKLKNLRKEPEAKSQKKGANSSNPEKGEANSPLEERVFVNNVFTKIIGESSSPIDKQKISDFIGKFLRNEIERRGYLSANAFYSVIEFVAEKLGIDRDFIEDVAYQVLEKIYKERTSSSAIKNSGEQSLYSILALELRKNVTSSPFADNDKREHKS
ncbi:hypothetical protein DRQ11_13575, partial [candidate division KSB1 bacterium]